jgi:hypothetical protein
MTNRGWVNGSWVGMGPLSATHNIRSCIGATSVKWYSSSFLWKAWEGRVGTTVSSHHSMAKLCNCASLLFPLVVSSPHKVDISVDQAWSLCPPKTQNMSHFYPSLPHMVLARYTAHTHSRTWWKSKLSLSLCPICGTALWLIVASPACYCQSCCFLVIRYKIQTASNTQSLQFWRLGESVCFVYRNPGSFFVCPFEKLKCFPSLETNFRVNCLWTFKILSPTPLVKFQWRQKWS